MPCTYDDPSEKTVYHDCKETQYKKQLDKVTRLLCYVMGQLGNDADAMLGTDSSSDARQLSKWWEKHKKMDAERFAREKAEQAKKKKVNSLKKKLTKEEIELIKKHL